MKVTTFGTRGSVPISRANSIRYGGNTTSVRLESACLPPGVALVLDTGSGYYPVSLQLLGEKIMNVTVLYTHFHHDHTQGMLLAPHTFIPTAHVTVYGPKEHEEGPRKVLQDIMRSPHFPVDFKRVAHRFVCHDLDHIGTQVLVVHPQGGFILLEVDVFERLTAAGKQLPFKIGKLPVSECLVTPPILTARLWAVFICYAILIKLEPVSYARQTL